MTRAAYFRPHNQSEDVRGLYLVGAGPHPGAGVPGAVGRGHRVLHLHRPEDIVRPEEIVRPGVNVSEPEASMEYVTLVDAEDRVLGTAEKMKAHREALLHRACSVVLFNEHGEMLLQQRNPAKYHSGGLWSNTCCTHPRPGESPADAAARRLHEEMGMTADLRPAMEFVYRAEFGDGLIEYEYDHVFVGRAAGPPHPDEAEVADWRWASMDEVADDMVQHPSLYTRWFPLLLEHLRKV